MTLTPIARQALRIFPAPTCGALFFSVLASLASTGCSSSAESAPAGTGAVCGGGTVGGPGQCDVGSVVS